MKDKDFEDQSGRWTVNQVGKMEVRQDGMKELPRVFWYAGLPPFVPRSVLREQPTENDELVLDYLCEVPSQNQTWRYSNHAWREIWVEIVVGLPDGATWREYYHDRLMVFSYYKAKASKSEPQKDSQVLQTMETKQQGVYEIPTENGSHTRELLRDTKTRTTTIENNLQPQPMTRDELLTLHRDLCEKGRSIMSAKNKDYAGGSRDIFSNFRASETFDVAPEIALMIRCTDKFKRIESFVKNGNLAVKSESVEDAIVDVINYMVLCAGLIEQRKQASLQTT